LTAFTRRRNTTVTANPFKEELSLFDPPVLDDNEDFANKMTSKMNK